MITDKLYICRGIRNNNPFNLKLSHNSWKGKISYKKNTDKVFEQFISIDYGLRAGFLLLRNAYLNKGYDTPQKIIERYAPSSENNVHNYLMFIIKDCPLDFDTKISINSLTFYWLCHKILRYESEFNLSYEKYCDIIKKFNLW